MIPYFVAGGIQDYRCSRGYTSGFMNKPYPLLETLCPYVADIRLGDQDIHDKAAPVLSDEKLFGVNLYEAGLGELTEQYFIEMLAGAGAVAAALMRYA